MNKQNVIIQASLAAVLFITEARASVQYTIANAYVGGATSSGYADLETFNVNIDGSAINGALAGGIVISQAGTLNSALPATYTTICTDISGTLYLGQTYTYATPVSAFNGTLSGLSPKWGADNASGLADQTSADKAIQNAAYLFYNYSGGLSRGVNGTGLEGSADQMAALQLAVWEALYDTTASGSVTGTRFQVSSTGAVVTAAAALVATLNGSYNYTGDILFPDPPNDSQQYNGNTEPPQELLLDPCTIVPEASTIICGALLLLPFGASSLRILRRSRPGVKL
jgi:hypothetical protein